MMANYLHCFALAQGCESHTTVRCMFDPAGCGKIFEEHGNGGITYAQVFAHSRGGDLLAAFLHGIDDLEAVTDAWGKFLDWLFHILSPRKWNFTILKTGYHISKIFARGDNGIGIGRDEEA